MNNNTQAIIFFLVCLSTLLSVVSCQTVCFGKDSAMATVCSGRGSCVSNNTCICQTNYTGVECQFTTCNGVNSSSPAVCSGNGQCVALDTCTCTNAFSGATCATPGCFGLAANSASVCSGRGTCTGANTCSCLSGFTGSQCESFTCAARNNCNGRGTCVGPNQCKCNAGFYGWSCEATTVCAPSNVILALPFDMPNPTLVSLGLAPESISNNAAMLSNTTYSNDTGSCGTSLFFGQHPNAEAVYNFHFDASVRFQMEFKFKLPKTLVGDQVLVWISNNNPSIVVRSTNAALVVELIVNVNVTKSISFASAYRDDLWHHMTIQRDGSVLRFLVDGFDNTAVTITESTFTSAFITSGNFSLLFGRTPSYLNLFRGYLDEFKIYRGCFSTAFLPLITDCKSCSCTGTPCIAGNACRDYTCSGIAPTNAAVCNRVGSCVGPDTCLCPTAILVGPTCNIPICDGKNASDPTVCSARGVCSSPNNCTCNRAFVGFTCQDFSCSGKNRTDATVCSGHGTCSAADTCSCNAKYSGPACSIPECFTVAGDNVNVCSAHGTCSNVDTCTCNAGYSGSQCETLTPGTVTCFGRAQTDPSVCGGTTRGFCASADRCVCNTGYNGTTCQLTVCFGKNSNDANVCGGSGSCNTPNTCTCNANFFGTECQTTRCFGINSDNANVCGGKQCVGPDTCKCDDGFVGDCSIPVCFGRNKTDPLVCNGKGTCSGPNTCSCTAPTTGTQCEVNACFGKTSLDASVCSGHGSCVGTDSCQCAANYFGNNCQTTICNGVFNNDTNVCSGHGVCSSPFTCSCFQNDNNGYYTGANCATCRSDYTGAECKTKFCDAATTCNGRGTCTGTSCSCSGNFAGDFCSQCVPGFVGPNCDIACAAAEACSGHGTCRNSGGCDCSQSLAGGFWTGVNCNTCSTGYFGANCRYGVGTLTFAGTGDRLVGFYTNPNVTNPVDCSSIVNVGDINSLGSRPFCFWNTPTEFVIVFGSSPTLVAGGSLRLSTGGNTFAPATIVNPTTAIIAPVANVIAPTTVGSCDSIILDASFSNNTDRRALTYTWTVAEGFKTADIGVFLALPNQNSPVIQIPASILFAGNSYTFTLVLRNFLLATSAPVSVTVTKSSLALPLARILGTPNQRTTINRFLRIEGVAVTTSCFTDTAGIVYSWRQVSGPKVSPIADGRFLTFAPRTFGVYGDYVFELRVSPLTSTSVFSAAQVTITVVPTALIAVIASGDRTVSPSFALDASASSDPDAITGITSRYSWRCIDSAGDTCSHASLTNIPAAASVNFANVPAGVYTFVLTFLKGSRFATASAKITVSATEVPVCQVLVRNRRANRNEPLALEASVSYSSNTSFSFVWSIVQSNGAVLSLSAANMYTASATGRSLTLREDVLELGQTYSVRFQATTVGGAVGTSSNDLQINVPPLPGTFTVSPATGSALSTVFTMSSSGWADDDLPLSYSFGYKDANGAYVPLVDKSASNSLSTILPAGVASNGNRRTIVATIFDNLGASTQREFIVTVDPFTATTVADITRVTDGLIANATGDAEAAARVASAAAGLLSTLGTASAGQVANQFLNLISSSLNSASATSKPITSSFMDNQARTIAMLISNRNTQPDTGVALSILTSLVSRFTGGSRRSALQTTGTTTPTRVPATTASSVCEALGNLMAYINVNTSASYYGNILSTSKSFVGAMANGMSPAESAILASCAGLKLYGQTDFVSNLNGKNVAFGGSAAQVVLPSNMQAHFANNHAAVDAASIRGVVYETNIYGYHTSSNTTSGSVVSFSLFDRSSNEIPVMDMSSPIVITIPGTFDVSKFVLDTGLSGIKPVCKYWKNGWVSDSGCSVISVSSSSAVVQTNHLTDFIIASENVVLDDKYIPPANIKTSIWAYNPTTTVFAGVSVLAYVAMMIIMYIVDQTRGARLTLSQEKEKELLKIGYVRTIVENFKKYHVWLSVIVRPLTEQEHYTRPQRITVIFTILFTFMAVNAMLVGTYPLEKNNIISGFFVASAFISNLVAIPIVGLITYLFRKLKVRREQPLAPVPNITFENKSFELEELGSLPVPAEKPLPEQPKETPKPAPASNNLVMETIKTTDDRNKIAEDSDDEDLPATKPSTNAKAAKLANKSTDSKVNATFANDFEDEELRDAPVTAAVANKPLDNEPAPAPALVDDDDDDNVADDDVLPRPDVPVGKTVADPKNATTTTGTNTAVQATFANDFENEELGGRIDTVDDKPEDRPAPALDDDDDDDVDDADVLPPPPVPLGQTVQDKPAESTNASVASVDEVKKSRKEYRKSIKANVKVVETAMGEKTPTSVKLADKVGSILDKGDDTLDGLRAVQKVSVPFSILNTLLFTVLYWVFHIAFVILLHLSCYYFWRPWFTTLYMMIMGLVYIGIFEVVYFQTKYKKWRLEKTWTINVAEVLIPVMLGVATIVGLIITIAVGAGLTFWNTFEGIGTGHVVSVLVCLFLLLCQEILFIVLTVWKPKPYSVAKSQESDNAPWIAPWMLFVIYPLTWAYYIGCFFIIVLFGYYMTGPAGGLWVAAYAISIVLDLFAFKLGHVIVMGYFMPLYYKAVDAIFFRPWVAKKETETSNVASVPVGATNLATAPAAQPVITVPPPTLIEEPAN